MNTLNASQAAGLDVLRERQQSHVRPVLGTDLHDTFVLAGDDDSCWVRIQGATTQTTNHASGWVRWNDMAGGSDWQWDVVHSSDGGNAEVEWTMAAGTYTLEIAYREDGALIDAILITKIR